SYIDWFTNGGDQAMFYGGPYGIWGPQWPWSAAELGQANNPSASPKYAGLMDVINAPALGQASTTTALASSANPSASGQSVTFTATVSVSGAGTPTGTVTFMDGSTILGTVTLSTSRKGVTTASFTLSTLDVGSHSITAIYSGDTNNTSSVSAALAQVV